MDYQTCVVFFAETLDAIKVGLYPFAYTGPIFRDVIVPFSTRFEMLAKSDKNSPTIGLCDIVIISWTDFGSRARPMCQPKSDNPSATAKMS